MDKTKKYNFEEIESKWQKVWEEKADIWQAKDFSDKPKYYSLFEFPYPSGEGLHMGHLRGQTAVDIIGRKKRLEGYNVLQPIGWDAFGLPTENYAIKNKIHPAVATEKNIESIKKQEKKLGYLLDWSREINTTDPKYYKWTQWLFLQFFKKGLAYKAEMPINWCPKDKIGLAKEEVIDGKCERCGTPVEKKNLNQWMLRITAYADKLIEGLKDLDFPERVKTQQINWIGRSEGTIIKFDIASEENQSIESKKIAALRGYSGYTLPSAPRNDIIEVFTSRADTLFGVVALVLAPEHPLVDEIAGHDERESVEKYILEASKKTDIERTSEDKEKTGVFTGAYVLHPLTAKKIPVWVADYVLADYGTGAVMMVPAHDERDFEFAQKYNLPIQEVIIPKLIDCNNPPIDGVDTVFRKAIQAIVVNPKNNKVLTLKWRKLPWTTFITGGVDEGEDLVEAAKREVYEETGYKNLKYIRTLGGQVESHFFAKHKNENRKAHFSALVFELLNEQRDDISEKEKDIHEPVWTAWEDISKDLNLKCCEYPIWLDRLNNPEHAFVDYGVLVNSEEFNGLTSEEAKKKITEKLKAEEKGDFVTNYRLRDWVFSRQHYWGEPIPIIYCRKCWENLKFKNQNLKLGKDFIVMDGEEYAIVPVPEKDLPVILPDVEHYEPTDTGESPLANMDDWVNVDCPKCGGKAKRETDTMPNWAGSSWYFLRYIDPNNDQEFANFKKLQYWMPVDLYEGGMEHTTLHLLYSRFWNEFLHDIGIVPISEPYKKRVPHGIILAEDGRKMSKSFGNIVSPDEIVKRYGADTTRTYSMFIGPFDQTIAWDMKGLAGVWRFLNKVWENMAKENSEEDKELESELQKTIKGVTEDIDQFKMNTAVAKLMEFNNLLAKKAKVPKDIKEKYMLILYPFAPHIVEEIWHNLGQKDIIGASARWPKFDKSKILETMLVIPIQINGKIRGQIELAPYATEEDSKISLDEPNIKKYFEGKEIKKYLYIKGKIISIVI